MRVSSGGKKSDWLFKSASLFKSESIFLNIALSKLSIRFSRKRWENFFTKLAYFGEIYLNAQGAKFTLGLTLSFVLAGRASSAVAKRLGTAPDTFVLTVPVFVQLLRAFCAVAVGAAAAIHTGFGIAYVFVYFKGAFYTVAVSFGAAISALVCVIFRVQSRKE